MLTIFTGNPRSGKTASMVDLLIDLVEDRPLYVHAPLPAERRPGITPFHEGLKLPHTTVHASEWHTVLPDGAVLVVDEVQDLWRPRGPGAAVPEAIKALETHGHRGIDIFVTTQKPKLVDANVRAMAGRHVHIRDTGWLGRYSYEWPEFSETLAWKTCHLKRRFKVPKRTFNVYKSANEHTKVERGRSMMPLITAALVSVAVLLCFMVYRTIAGKVETKPAAQAASAPALGSSIVRNGAPITARELRASFVPRIPAEPNSAPAYDEIRKVVAMPRIMGGYCQAGECHCFIQDGRRAPIDANACYHWLKDPPFDPYYVRPEVAERQDYSRRAAVAASAPIAAI
jgi:zona occludens toxin